MKAWLFDIDGVITNPTEKKITEPEIISEIIKLLERGEPIGLNTGRSIDFIVENVLKVLEDKIQNKRILDYIIAIGEKGGVRITYVNGKRKEEIDEDIKVPEDLKKEVLSLIETEFSKTMFFDKTKKTMISTEMKKGMNLNTYHEEQKILAKILSGMLKKMNYSEFKIDANTIATDIENKYAGKALGARKFLKLLKERGINPDDVTAFGDSNSDFDMLDPLRESGIPFKFIFVGDEKVEKKEFEIILQGNFDKGTLDYLKNN